MRRYLQLDVFSATAGAGNPLGVVTDAHALRPTDMQAIAAWLNLSETIFFLPPQAGADYHIRIFTPARELPFAGHPSVGAAWAARHLGLVNRDAVLLQQQCAAGLLPVQVAGDALHVRAPRARCIEQIVDVDAALPGIGRGAMLPALWDNGPRWCVVELADAAAVRALQPDLPAIAALCGRIGAVGVAVFGLADDAPDHALAVRAFCPADGIPEDPVTGSANACIAAALAAADRLPAARYIASQGRELGRDGRIAVQVDADGEVWIGGAVQCVIDGQLQWSTPAA